MDRAFLYVGDPMCSWCWGFSPQLETLSARHELPVEVVVGGLRPGAQAEPLGHRLRSFLDHEWSRIAEVTGQPFDPSALDREDWVYDTEPAARAVVTMRSMDPDLAFPFFERLQRAFYAEAVDVTDLDAHPPLAEELGVDREEFTRLLRAEESRKMAWADFAAARRMGISGFPTLLLRDGRTAYLLARGYRSADDISPLVESMT